MECVHTTNTLFWGDLLSYIWGTTDLTRVTENQTDRVLIFCWPHSGRTQKRSINNAVTRSLTSYQYHFRYSKSYDQNTGALSNNTQTQQTNKQTHTRDTQSFPRCPTWLACVTFPVCQSPLEPHECRETWHSTAWAGFLVDSTCSEDVIGSISDKRNGRFLGRWVESRVNISLYWIFTPYIFPSFKFCRCMHFFLLPTFWIIPSHFFFLFIQRERELIKATYIIL